MVEREHYQAILPQDHSRSMGATNVLAIAPAAPKNQNKQKRKDTILKRRKKISYRSKKRLKRTIIKTSCFKNKNKN